MPAPAKKSEAKKPDRVDLRLYNTIAIFDDYIVARSPEAARETLMTMIEWSSDCAPTELVVKEVTMANSIRASKTGDNPWIANDITEAELESLRGITVEKAFERFYQKR